MPATVAQAVSARAADRARATRRARAEDSLPSSTSLRPHGSRRRPCRRRCRVSARRTGRRSLAAGEPRTKRRRRTARPRRRCSGPSRERRRRRLRTRRRFPSPRASPAAARASAACARWSPRRHRYGGTAPSPSTTRPRSCRAHTCDRAGRHPTARRRAPRWRCLPCRRHYHAPAVRPRSRPSTPPCRRREVRSTPGCDRSRWALASSRATWRTERMHRRPATDLRRTAPRHAPAREKRRPLRHRAPRRPRSSPTPPTPRRPARSLSCRRHSSSSRLHRPSRRRS